MSKEDWIWVAIRIFGIYLVVLAIMAVPGVANSAFMVWNYRDLHLMHQSMRANTVNPSDVAKRLAESGKEAPAGEVADKVSQFSKAEDMVGDVYAGIYTSSISALLSGLCRLFLFAGCGAYFLRSGRIIFRLVAPRGDGPVPSPAPGLSDPPL